MQGANKVEEKIGKELKEKRLALIKEHEEKTPYFAPRRRLIFCLLLVMVLSRAVHAVLQTAYLMMRGVQLQAYDYCMMILMIIVAYVFASLIYAFGIKPAVYLALFGGVFSLFNAWRNQVFLYLNTPDVFYNIVSILLVVVMLFQIGVMLFLCVDKKCQMYLGSMSKIQKEISELMKR
jgi:hypothetical protein